MNNHNFVDWEITKMLPENKNGLPLYIDDEGDIIMDDSATLFGALPVYTWEDVRLYLESEGYIINICPHNCNSGVDYFYEVCRGYWSRETDTEFYNTYNEARREAIIYCLNQINSGTRETI